MRDEGRTTNGREKEYSELGRARRSAEYLSKIGAAIGRVAEGRLVVKPMEDLRPWIKLFRVAAGLGFSEMRILDGRFLIYGNPL